MADTHAGYAGRMFLEFSAPARAATSSASSKKSSVLWFRKPRCLRLTVTAGPMPTYTWATDGALRTELLMRNGMEFPNGVAVVTLSQILEANVPVTYYLSATACAGILRRASARGKTLPEILRLALERQSRERNPFTA